jgi:hypothetical protein
MPKKYAKTWMSCQRCEDRIKPGDLIVLSRDGGWIHGRCFRRRLAASAEVVKRRKKDGTWPEDGRQR